MTTRRHRLASIALGPLVVLGVAACGADSGATGIGPAASQISLSSDQPFCSPAGSQQLCSLKVGYVNTSADAVEIDATSTVVKDLAGVVHAASAGEGARTLSIDPGSQGFVQWGVTIPINELVAEVVWMDGQGREVSLRLAGSPTPTASTGPSTAPVSSATASSSATAPPTESLTPAPPSTPPPAPTRTATPTPKPTRSPTPTASATPRPSAPIGTIG